MRRKFLWGFLVVFALGLIIAPGVYAAQFKGGENYVLRSGEKVEENLYVGGSNVSVEGEVDGDLFASGGVVTVSGPTSGDVTIAGGTVNIFGDIEGDLRAAGGNITVSGSVGGEVLIAGGNLRISSDSTFKKDVLLVGGNIVVDGIVEGKLSVRGGDLTLNGIIHKDVSAKMDGKVALDRNTEIKGGLNYEAPKEANIAKEAKIGGVVAYDKILKKYNKDFGANDFKMGLIVMMLLKLITFIVVGLILYFLFRKDTEKVVEASIEKPGRKFIIGFVVLITLPIAAIISFFSVVGAPLGVSALFLYGAFFVQGMIYAGIIFGSMLHKLFFKKGDLVSWKTVIVGIIILSLIKLVPILGWLVGFIMFLIAFGAILELMFERFRKK